MLLTVSFFAALAGAGFAACTALLPDTGIDGTVGAFLAAAGAVAVVIALGLLLLISGPERLRVFLAGMATFVAVLTAIAAWFLMQNALLAAMAIALLALLTNVFVANREVAK